MTEFCNWLDSGIPCQSVADRLSQLIPDSSRSREPTHETYPGISVLLRLG